jgi:WD40 repeat protein/serine/threonine protein kinase
MAVAEVHPSVEELAAFTLGTLGDESQASIEAHLASCPACQERAAGSSCDSLVELLRRVHARPAAAVDTMTEAPQGHTPTPRPHQAVAVAPLLVVPVGSDPANDLNAIPPELARHERYRVMRLLGQGGMGSVYEAEQIAMQRRVALKVIRRAGTASPDALERFRREVRAAARPSHPNVVTAYDAETAGELHFLVMEYVQGISLAWLVKERGPLPTDEACAYIQQAALGLQHAHERGLVHRDIKPDNLIRCSDGTVKILDFGLAALTAERGAGLTEANVVMGTPEYMAPEQAEDSHHADIRADLYSLGCTLYYLLTGKAPYPATTPLLKVLAHRDRPVPSLRRARPDVPQELAAVVERLLAKRPEDRCQTPRELAGALKPFTRLPTKPRPKRVSLLVAAAVTALLAGIVLAGAAVYRIATDKGELVVQTDNDDVEVVVSKGGQVVKIIDTKSGKNVTLNSGDYELTLKDGQEGLKLSLDKMTLKRGETVLATITRRDKPGDAVAEKPAAKRPTDGLIAWWRADGNAKDSVGHHDGALKGEITFAPGVAAQAFRLDGATRYVEVPRSDLWGFGTRDFSIELWVQFRAVTPSHDIGHPSAVFIGCDEGNGSGHKWFFAYGDGFLNFHVSNANGKGGFYAKAEFSPDLDQWYHLAVTRSQGTFTTYVDGLPVASEKVDVIIPFPDAPLTIGQAEGGAFVSGLIDEVAIYERALSPDEVKARWRALAPAGKHVAQKVGVVRTFWGHTNGAWGVAFSPDGRHALSGAGDGTVRLWDVATGREVHRFSGHDKPVEDLAYSPDGRQALTASQDKAVRLWDVQTGKEIRELKGHTDFAYRVAFSPDGRRALSGSRDGTIRLWDLGSGNELRRFTPPTVGVAFSPDGRRALSGGLDHLVRLWDAETGAEVRHLRGHTGLVTDVVFLPGGRQALSCSYDQTLRLWDLDSGEEIRVFTGHTHEVQKVAISRDGRYALSASKDKTVRLWNLQTGKELHCFKGHTAEVIGVAISPDGKFCLSGSWDNSVRLWRLPDPPPAKENP